VLLPAFAVLAFLGIEASSLEHILNGAGLQKAPEFLQISPRGKSYSGLMKLLLESTE
jgi:fructose/tagatose bisphosphate aldolase